LELMLVGCVRVCLWIAHELAGCPRGAVGIEAMARQYTGKSNAVLMPDAPRGFAGDVPGPSLGRHPGEDPGNRGCIARMTLWKRCALARTRSCDV
jgi:hypothetical protein